MGLHTGALPRRALKPIAVHNHHWMRCVGASSSILHSYIPVTLLKKSKCSAVQPPVRIDGPPFQRRILCCCDIFHALDQAHRTMSLFVESSLQLVALAVVISKLDTSFSSLPLSHSLPFCVSHPTVSHPCASLY